jgi:integrase
LSDANPEGAMKNAIAKVERNTQALALPADVVNAARDFAKASRSARTLQVYRAAWQTFTAWCEAHGLASLPAVPETVALYLSARANEGRKPATVALDLAAISQAHKVAGHTSSRGAACVREVFAGIRRTLGAAQRRVAPLLPGDLRAVSSALPAGLLGLRDRALLLLGFAGAFRRSELAALEVSDLAFTADGLEALIRRSKTDQEGAGRKIGIPFGSDPSTCPVRVVKAWLEAAKLEAGPVFREVTRHGHVEGAPLTGRSIARIVKRSAEAAGLDPARFSGHSLRAGLATAAAKAGKSTHAIMRQTGHRSANMVARYVREASLFEDNAASGIGL